ncbi:hypothetical protein TNCV_4738551 [Trichonephila clavipes]|nr:hypothetical protein TNCV_4738551 [Trichonephila clavipes]
MIEHRWCDGHVCPDVGQEIMVPLVQTSRVCICVLRMNRTREAEADFCGLPMRRDEGHVVDPPLVFKKGFFRRREKSPGWRELEESTNEKESWTVEDREWSGKNGETMIAGGVGELE